MIDVDETDVCTRALERWGAKVQMRLLQEECAELIAVINQHERGRASDDQVADELADVLVMLGQAFEVFGPERVEQALDRKLARLKQRLDETDPPAEKDPPP